MRFFAVQVGFLIAYFFWFFRKSIPVMRKRRLSMLFREHKQLVRQEKAYLNGKIGFQVCLIADNRQEKSLPRCRKTVLGRLCGYLN